MQTVIVSIRAVHIGNAGHTLTDGKGTTATADDNGKTVTLHPGESILTGNGDGHAIANNGVTFLWALEKNVRAIAFYRRHGFRVTGDRMPEDDTEEYLVRLER